MSDEKDRKEIRILSFLHSPLIAHPSTLKGLQADCMSYRKGVTLIELVVTIAVMGALAVGFAAYMKQAMDIWKFLSYRTEVVSQARLGALRMASDIRQISDANSVGTAADTSLNFTHISNGPQGYYYLNGTLYYWGNDTANTAQPLMTGVTSFNFTYYAYNTSNSTLYKLTAPVSAANISQIKIINVNATLQWGDQKANINLDARPRNIQ
jgi:prepilin-type N-terminal cleavage/methylation domain-containing protein